VASGQLTEMTAEQEVFEDMYLYPCLHPCAGVRPCVFMYACPAGIVVLCKWRCLWYIHRCAHGHVWGGHLGGAVICCFLQRLCPPAS
jgi:hypothetical protein